MIINKTTATMAMYMAGRGAAETGGTSTRSKIARKTLGSEINNTYQYDYG